MASKEIRSTNQIAKVQTARKCISLMDKLKAVDPRHYAQLHAKGEIGTNGFKQNSLIQVLIQDYSNGTGANNIKVSFNLSPEQIQFFLTRVSAGFLEYEFSADKIFGDPDQNGYCQAQQFRLKRSVRNENGQENRSPWNIFISNGRGIKVQNQNGGSYMSGGSYQKEKSAFIQLTDMDFYMLLKRADSYINAWEKYSAEKVLPEGLRLFEQEQARNQTRGYAPVSNAPSDYYGQSIGPFQNSYNGRSISHAQNNYNGYSETQSCGPVEYPKYSGSQNLGPQFHMSSSGRNYSW